MAVAHQETRYTFDANCSRCWVVRIYEENPSLFPDRPSCPARPARAPKPPEKERFPAVPHPATPAHPHQTGAPARQPRATQRVADAALPAAHAQLCATHVPHRKTPAEYRSPPPNAITRGSVPSSLSPWERAGVRVPFCLSAPRPPASLRGRSTKKKKEKGRPRAMAPRSQPIPFCYPPARSPRVAYPHSGHTAPTLARKSYRHFGQ